MNQLPFKDRFNKQFSKGRSLTFSFQQKQKNDTTQHHKILNTNTLKPQTTIKKFIKVSLQQNKYKGIHPMGRQVIKSILKEKKDFL